MVNVAQSPHISWKPAGLSTCCKVALCQEKSPGEQEVMSFMFLAGAAAAAAGAQNEQSMKLCGWHDMQ